DRVAVIEDVITTGGSALQAIQALQSFGATITGILALIDREEGGRAALEQAGFSVIALTTASQIAALMNKQ
ncbi:MAG: hypothetical protein JJE16_13105, partial [Nitrospiraceae bacterium]|nr:hypothetical protein [Nitrospiraceae bacterium]